MSAVGATNTIEFSMHNNLGGANLTATVPLDDVVAGTSFTVTANLVPALEASCEKDLKSRTREPGLVITTVFNGNTRAAKASGTISDGATNFIPPGSLVDAELQAFDTGEITITGK